MFVETLIFAVRDKERCGCIEELWLCNLTQHMDTPVSRNTSRSKEYFGWCSLRKGYETRQNYMDVGRKTSHWRWRCIAVTCAETEEADGFQIVHFVLVFCTKHIKWTRDGMSLPMVYRVSQEECEILRESVPYVKLYRYNPKNLYPKLNGYGGNDQRSLKLWQLLHTYWLPNTYWNWQEYVVSVMLIYVLNIKVTCEWHKAIKLNYKNSRTNTRGCL